MKWPSRRDPERQQPDPSEQADASTPTGPVLIHALDGFLTAGGAPRIAAEHLLSGRGEVVRTFDVD